MLEKSSDFSAAARGVITLGLVVLVTIILWRIRELLTLANFSLIYLLLTLLIAVWLGTIPSLIAAVISFLCFNFFLIEPYYTLAVKDPREVVDLFIFLLVAVITGQLTAYARQQARAARYRVEEQNVLYGLSSAFNQLHNREGVYETLQTVLRQSLPITHCDVLSIHDTAPPRTEQTAVYSLISLNNHVFGTLRTTFHTPPSESQQRFLMACVVQAAMVLQRIELAESVQRGQAIEEADKLKTTLLHAVSHDLRTPITIIKTAASNLRILHLQLSPQEKQEMTAVIEQEADNLDKLVGNLLDMSRLQAGAITLNLEPNSLEEVAGDVAARVFQRTKQERIRLDFPEDFPLIAFDYVLLLQALTNLVDNALRYEPDNQQIHLRGVVQPSEVQVRVTNHGDRIRPEDEARIMEPFYHGGRGKTGLGLAIAKGIVEAHQGRLWVEQDGGTTFVLALPRGQQEEAHDT